MSVKYLVDGTFWGVVAYFPCFLLQLVLCFEAFSAVLPCGPFLLIPAQLPSTQFVFTGWWAHNARGPSPSLLIGSTSECFHPFSLFPYLSVCMGGESNHSFLSLLTDGMNFTAELTRLPFDKILKRHKVRAGSNLSQVTSNWDWLNVMRGCFQNWVGTLYLWGALVHQICSFFEHCSKSRWPPLVWTLRSKFFLMDFIKSA